MTEFPYELFIRGPSLKKEGESLVCLSLIRAVPNKRCVYDAIWADKAVIVKVFLDKLSAPRHLKREWHGLCQLQKRQMDSPKPLFFGKTLEGHLAMVTEKISDAHVAMDIFIQANLPQKLQLLNLVCDLLAIQHSKGILQKDLHLGNFLLQQNKLFVIDPAQMRFYQNPISIKLAISQLAMLAAAIPEENIDEISNLCNRYAANRCWKFTDDQMKTFWKKISACRALNVEKGLKKCLYSNKRYVRISKHDNYAVGRKDFFEKIEAAEFLKNIDALMKSGQILKNGNTCFVSRIKLGDKDIVIKRYNHKGIIHSIRHTIKKSRARRNWLHAHRLLMLGIATATPLAFIEKRIGVIVKQSYFIAEYVDGPKLCDFLQDKAIVKEQKSRIVTSINKLLATLGKHRITHGDLKHSNILIVDDKPTLIDLDSMQVHRYLWLYNLKNKDSVHI